MNFDMILDKVKDSANDILNKLEEDKPEIFLWGGLTMIVGGFVWACMNTRKLDDTLEQSKDELKAARALKQEIIVEDEDGKPVHTEELRNLSCQCGKELVKTYGKIGLRFGKLYAGPAALVGTGIALVVDSHAQMEDRCTEYLSGWLLTEKAFDRYRARVVKDQGSEKDEEYRYGAKLETVDAIVLDDDGNPKLDKKGKPILESSFKLVMDEQFDDHGDVIRMYDSDNTPCWDKNYSYNKSEIIAKRNALDYRLKHEGYLTFNDMLMAYGYPPTAGGQVLGLVYDKNDPNLQDEVDVGIWDKEDNGQAAIENITRGENWFILRFKGLHCIVNAIPHVQNFFA